MCSIDMFERYAQRFFFQYHLCGLYNTNYRRIGLYIHKMVPCILLYSKKTVRSKLFIPFTLRYACPARMGRTMHSGRAGKKSLFCARSFLHYFPVFWRTPFYSILGTNVREPTSFPFESHKNQSLEIFSKSALSPLKISLSPADIT
jgi:hypothetical protein